MDLFYCKKKLVLDLEQRLHNFSFLWLNIEFLYQNYGLILLETSNLFEPWLTNIFVSLGLSQVDIIVSLKMACSWSTTTFYIFLPFFTKIDERKNWIFWGKLWINPFCKNTIFDTLKNGHFCWSKKACSWSTTTFYIISSFFHQKLRKLNFFYQNDGLTPIDRDWKMNVY